MHSRKNNNKVTYHALTFSNAIQPHICQKLGLAGWRRSEVRQGLGGSAGTAIRSSTNDSTHQLYSTSPFERRHLSPLAPASKGHMQR